MKIIASIVALSLTALTAPSASAAEASALMQKAGCMACHTLDKKMLGPSFKDIAAKYKGKDAEAMLIKKVKEGGAGVWGQIPMPPNGSKLSDGEYKTVIAWVLTQ